MYSYLISIYHPSQTFSTPLLANIPPYSFIWAYSFNWHLRVAVFIHLIQDVIHSNICGVFWSYNIIENFYHVKKPRKGDNQNLVVKIGPGNPWLPRFRQTYSHNTFLCELCMSQNVSHSCWMFRLEPTYIIHILKVR